MTRTLPPPPSDTKPHRTYQLRDRISVPVNMPGGYRRLVGDVTDTSYWIFSVTWAGGYGVARYAHGHEPDGMRHATPADEDAANPHAARRVAAGEFLRLASRHTGWPPQVLHALRLRAAELTGDTR